MANKITNFSDLITRVAASCLLHPLASTSHTTTTTKHPEHLSIDIASVLAAADSETSDHDSDETKVQIEDDEKEKLMAEVFEAVSEMKRAYVRLQEAHSPWDPEKMRVADVAVVSELRRIGVLRERFRRCGGGRDRLFRGGGETVREVVAPYEAAVEELKMEVKEREVEIQNLKEKIRIDLSLSCSTITTTSSSNRSNGFGKKHGRRSSIHHHSKKPIRVSCINHTTIQGAPTRELFEAMTRQVRETSKSFTSLLLSLMRSAHWDITAAVRSIEVAFTTNDSTTTSTITTIHHAKYALQSYLSNKIFQGFDHETFYMDGSLSSLLNPDQFRRDCFTQYCDMKSMDPIELLGVLPTCHFGKFCSRKYLSIIHPKMEESLFGNTEQHHQLLDGNHPRSQFYGKFLGLAKSVWLLHLLAFSFDPCPNYFEASRGVEFHAQYMESVVKFSGGRVPPGQIVGFPVCPGFKHGNGSVIKSRVYLVSKT